MSSPLRLSRRAFTLVELLVVIVILGILIAIAVPSFMGTRDKANDAQAQSSITVAAHNAKAAWVDEESYQTRDFLAGYLTLAEPGLAFKTTNTFVDQGPNTLFVNVTDSGQTVVLCAESNSGTWFCLTENAEGALRTSVQEAPQDEPQQLAASGLSLAKSWGPTLADAICHLPTAEANGGVGCAGGGPGWAKESGDDNSEAQSEGVPEITLVTTPPSETMLTNANFDWTVTNSPTSVQCKLDGGSFTACSAPYALTDVSVGEHTLEVRAINGYGVGPSVEYDWTVTAPVPTITIVSGPPATTQTTTAVFDYTDTGSPTSYQCKLDGGSFTLCSYALTYTGLSVGSHTFVMQATNGSGTGTSNTWSWTVLPAAPTVTLADTPTDHTTNTDATFTWTTGGGPVTTTECKLDGGPYTNCSTPRNLTGLSAGSHTFQVKVTNAGGSNESTPYTWTIDALPAPTVTLTGGPAEGSSSAVDSGTFSWTSTNAATTTCSLDGGAFTTCTSPHSYGPLSAASHTFQVKVTNATAPSGVTTPLRTWTVQETYSQTVIASGATHYFRLNETGPSCSATADSVGSGTGTYYGAYIGATTFTCGVSSGGPLTGTTGASNKFISKTSGGASSGGDKINAGATGTGLFFGGSSSWAGDTGTIEVWFKTSDLSAGSHFVYDKYGATAALFDSGVLNVYSYNGAVSRNFSGLADGGWHHLVVATSGANIRIVIDGVQQVNNASNGTPNNSKSATFGYRGVGGDGNSATPTNVNDQGYFFTGSLDEIAFYPTMLSAADALAHYNARTR